MKKSIYLIAATTLAISTILSSCNSSTEKVKDAQEDVKEANKALNVANEEYLADIESYRLEMAAKIEANNKSIKEFNERVALDKKKAKADYQERIAELEKKNSDMKLKMDKYKAEGKDEWESFKTEFSHDMDGLGAAIKNIGVKNVK
jgi:predicted small secreted protein